MSAAGPSRSRAGEAEATAAAGLVWLSGNLGGLVVALVVGLLVGSPALAFLICGVLCLASVPGAWFVATPTSDGRTSTRRSSRTSVSVATR